MIRVSFSEVYTNLKRRKTKAFLSNPGLIKRNAMFPKNETINT